MNQSPYSFFLTGSLLHKLFVRLLLTIVMVVEARAACADVRLPRLISDGMVLQQGVPVKIWGWADEGEQVSVGFQGQKVSAIAKGGRWEAALAPLEPGGPFVLTFAGKNKIELADVLVGEVWVSCGQSNMMMGLGTVTGGPEAIAESVDHPQIRLFNVGNAQAAAPAEDCAGKWTAANRATLSGFSAVSYFFGREINRRLGVPVGLINAVAIVPGESWIDEATLLSTPALSGMTANAIKPVVSYNGMIAPLTHSTVRGAIYYQGEYNAGRGREYRDVLPAIIRSWRKQWGQDDFPFLFVQLPGYHEHRAEKDQVLDMPDAAIAGLHTIGASSPWAEVREAQLLTWQAVPNTGMAVAIDLGDPQDIHPKNKRPVATRLSLAARAIAYGESIVHSGPLVESSRMEGDTVILRFKHSDGGLRASGGDVKGFELAGPDQRYVWADAQIKDSEIVLSSPDVPEPALVRYAWANYPRCNLSSAEGLPASPFRIAIPGKAYQIDISTIPFRNPGFEETDEASGQALHWIRKNAAERVGSPTSEGKWAMSLQPKGEITQDDIIQCGVYGYDWNSDLLEPNHFRPGTLTGYAVDVAAGPGSGLQTGYMRLCGHSTAGGSNYWGGIPTITTSSTDFLNRQIANRMTTRFDLDGRGMAVGTLFANQSPSGTLLLDNLTPITVVRPMIAVSDARPIAMGRVAVGKPMESQPRTIANGQVRTLPDKRTDEQPPKQVATLLYGVANLKASPQWGISHAWGETDHVGAMLVGNDAEHFEFVSPRQTGNPRELRLIGVDGEGGLTGGPEPETETLVVNFRGADMPRSYAATVRIVTQAGNTGILSRGGVGEPLDNLFYVDIPVTVEVGQ